MSTNAEVVIWLTYAGENLAVAELSLAHVLYNASIQNSQQAVEKALKALCISRNISVRKTHSIDELLRLLRPAGLAIPLSEDEADLFDTIYLPTKYPLAGLIPEFTPDAELAQRCFVMARNVLQAVRAHCGFSG